MGSIAAQPRGSSGRNHARRSRVDLAVRHARRSRVNLEVRHAKNKQKKTKKAITPIAARLKHGASGKEVGEGIEP